MLVLVCRYSAGAGLLLLRWWVGGGGRVRGPVRSAFPFFPLGDIPGCHSHDRTQGVLATSAIPRRPCILGEPEDWGHGPGISVMAFPPCAHPITRAAGGGQGTARVESESRELTGLASVNVGLAADLIYKKRLVFFLGGGEPCDAPTRGLGPQRTKSTNECPAGY